MNKRRGFLGLVILFSLIFSINFVFSYDSNAKNISLNTQQIYGEAISGTFLLNLIDAPINLIFSSSYGEITLRQLLTNAGKTLGCESYNCSGLYTTYGDGLESLDFKAIKKGVSYGLLYDGSTTSATGLNIKVSAIFPESTTIPLSIAVGKNYIWNFNSVAEDTTNFRQISYGCFNFSAPQTNGEIDTLGYCEEVNLTDAPSYYLGANVSGSGLKQLVFSLNKDGSEIKSCTVNLESAAYSSAIGCMASMSENQPAGKYEVCLRSSEENYVIYSVKKETSGPNCGRYSSGNKLADYSLFVKTPYYAASNGEVDLGENFGNYAIESINSYLALVYNSNCSSECVVPITLYGNNINVNVSNINSAYSSATGPIRSNSLYSLLEDVYRMDFSGIISFESFNWVVDKYGNSTLKIDLIENNSVKELMSKSFSVEPVPFATSIYPTSPPAGIDVYYYVHIGGNFSKVIWNFGDGSPAIESNNSYAIHKYLNVSATYNATVSVIGKNSTITRYFVLNTVSPEAYINDSISFKRGIFNNLSVKIDSLPYAIKDFVKQKLQFESIQNELTQIEMDHIRATSSNDFLNIVTRIDSLDIPSSILEYDTRSGSLTSSYSEIDPSIVKKIKPGNYSSMDRYVTPIFAWQLLNINSNVAKKKFEIIKKNKEIQKLLVYYEVSLKSSSNNFSYFIIQKPVSSLYFSSGVEVKDIGGNASYISLSPMQSLEFSFYLEGSDDVAMFISPSLEILQATEDVSVCKVNGLCQKSDGENSDNCPQDCKAILPTVLAIAGVLLFILIIYTILQRWYVKKYEEYLFKDRVFLFNLLTFINNSKLNGASKDSIASALSAKGWIGEQITYAIKKSEGKNTGMYEILPVQKIVAYYEMKKAEKVRSIKIGAPMANSNTVLRNNFPPKKPSPSYIGPRRDIRRI